MLRLHILLNEFTKKKNLGIKCATSKQIYEKTNKLTEKLSEIVYLFYAKVAIPGFVLPKAIVCFFVYFTTDRGPDAFELSLPFW